METRVSDIVTDPWTFRVDRPAGSDDTHRGDTLKADPFSQLKLLDVQELDSRIDLLATG